MASERDRCPAHVDGIPDRLYLRKEPDAYDWVHDQAPGIEPDETEYIRSDLSEQREAELVECLKEIHSLAFGDIAHDLEPEDALESIRVLAWREIAKHAKHKAEGRESG